MDEERQTYRVARGWRRDCERPSSEAYNPPDDLKVSSRKKFH
jgi:hypothetical protein